MIQFWRLGLKRAPVMWALAGVLYFIAHIETGVFIRYEKFLSSSNTLLFYAFALLLVGFGFGVLMVQAILVRQLRYEFGNFETLGFSRSQVLGYYFMQNLFVGLLALLPAILADLILSQFFAQKNTPLADFNRVFAMQGLLMSGLFTSFAVFLIVYSRLSPALLLKEKS